MSVELRIQQALAERAEAAGAPRFTAETVFREGARTKVRRQRARVLAAAVCVSVAVIGSVATTGWHRGAFPVASGATTSVAPPRGVSPASLKLNYAVGSQIKPWDGGLIQVPLPAGQQIHRGVRVPGGWVLQAASDSPDAGPSHVWWLPTVGDLVDLGHAAGGWVVSGDGQTLAIAGPGTVMTAYRLPTREKLATVTLPDQMAPVVLGVAGDWALFIQASGDGGPSRAGVWNIRTGAFTLTPGEVNIWGMSDDGHVLGRLPGPGLSCVDLVPIAELASLGEGGFCSAAFAGIDLRGKLSPAGALAALQRYEDPEWRTSVVRSADILDGRWEPMPIDPALRTVTWDTGTSFFGPTDDGRLLHCAGATCVPVALPAPLEVVTILINRGV